MNSTNFKQYDTRWNYLPYPTKKWNIGNSGCGEVTIANLIIEMNKWLNDTPKTIQPYCVQYAAPNGDGTYWSGIPAMMKHYGMTEVKEHDTMQQLFKELAKGDRMAVYLMGSASAGSNHVRWTSGGHFVGSVLYEKRGSEDWVYMKDPNSTSSLRNGWISYNGNIRGACLKVWSGKLNGSPAPTPTPTPTGKLVVDGVGGYETVKRLQEFLKLKDPDGLIGRQRKANAKWYPSLTAVSFATSGGSNTVTALQKWLGLSGPDGILGKNTTGALQKRLRDYGYLAKNESIDAIFGTKSMKALQTALNNDFKKKTDPTPPTPTPTKDTKVIDVSAFQDSINWAKVKASGIDGAMIRCGYRGYETGKLNQDSMFVDHISGASKAGLKVGVYFFTEALNYSEGKQEAEFTLGLIEKMGINLYYPIAVDTEAQSASTERAKNLSVAKRTDAIKGFCETIKAHGGTPMIYASTSWFENKLDMSKLPYDCWCAQYYKECQYKGKVVMWQYTSEGSVNGVKGVVDMNKCYITSPAPMPKPTPKPEPTPSGQHYTGEYPNVNRMKSLVDMAVKLAWAKGTAESKYKYPSGSATSAFKTALNKVYPEHTKWGKAPSVGASCDVFVGTVVRYAGLDSKFPRGLEEQFDYKPKNFIRSSYKNANALKKSQNGDIVMFDYGSGSHIVIRGNDMYYEANLRTYFGHTNESTSRLNDTYDKVVVLRPRNYLMKGDSGSEVLKWQDYLNWWSDGAFYKECGKGDGVFGANTDIWTKRFQEIMFGKAEADGTVGVKTITAAKSVRK